jgi:hypothetical protein
LGSAIIVLAVFAISSAKPRLLTALRLQQQVPQLRPLLQDELDQLWAGLLSQQVNRSVAVLIFGVPVTTQIK